MRYSAPSYQRPYVWRHDEDDSALDRLGPFWSDVKQTVERLVAHERLLKTAGDPERLAPMTPHFFGAVVVGEPEKAAAGVIVHEVIDGQQRLTTAQLLIAAAARMCEAAGKSAHASRLRKLWLQDEDVEVSDDERFKVRPTRHDRKAFGTIMDPTVSPLGGPDRLSAAHQYFVDQLRDWATNLPPGEETEYFDALRDTIYEQLLFVVIELQAGDNPQGIFESLNAQGERLLAIDLVKNHVFRRARRADMDIERLDTEVWSARFGDEWWRTDVKQGRYRRPRAELFLMHWLTEQTESEISATGLFVEFSHLFAPRRVDGAAVPSFIRTFIAHAGTYREFERLPVGSREQLFFARREVLDVSVVFPVTLRLWQALNSEDIDLPRLVIGLRAIESWLARRMIMRLTGKNYNRLMLELLKAMTASKPDPVVGLIRHLRSFPSGSLGWWPSDQEFRAHLVSRSLYGTISQARVRMLLEAAEARLFTPKTEQLQLPRKLTIEHVIPQTWEETWPLSSTASQEEIDRRVASIHQLGNLTLVTSSLNPALSNDPWAEKRAELGQHSALRLNAQLIHDHPSFFDEDAIDRRSGALADLLLAEWPGPDAKDWEHPPLHGKA